MSAKKSAKSKLVKEDIDEFPAKRYKNETFDEDDLSTLISQYQASAKKKKTETSSGSNPEYRKKILDLVNSQQEARKLRTKDFYKGFSEIITQVEVDYNAMRENEQRLEQLAATFMKCIQNATAAYKEKLTALREIQDSFKKEYEEMESEHQTETEKFVDELEYDINKLQNKLVAETKRSGWESLRRNLFHAMQKDL